MITRIDGWLFSAAPAERLGALRVLTCGFVVVYLIATVGEFDRLGSRDRSEFEPIGVISMFDAPFASSIIWLIFATAIVSGITATIGAWFRLSGPLFAGVTLLWVSYHSSFGQLLHFEHLFTIHLLILAVFPASDAWSFDARRSKGAVPGPSARYGWPISLMALATAITYVIAGIAKLRIGGLAWLDGSTLQNHIAFAATRANLLGSIEPPFAQFFIDQSWLLAPAAIGTVVIELAAPVALFGRLPKRFWVASAIILHTLTAATMLVWFPYQSLGFAFLAYFEPEKLRKQRPGKLDQAVFDVVEKVAEPSHEY